MNHQETPIENRIETNPFVHYLQNKNVIIKSNTELILKHLHNLPKDFMEMTLFDIDGCGSVFHFSHITNSEDVEGKAAVYKKLT
ncbi:hypothetical protein [Bacillus weihaiensis]|uniref:hypothetical protein n=1 Tax=Bacillus weihaiensis TaxID=1547283 RepID=UPI00235630BA|nr:hypothetical protein [Bacillus weihaiensis]